MPIKVTPWKSGTKISAPGLYRIPIEVYHSQCCVGPSTSSSELRKLFTDSPAHAWEESSLNPESEGEEDEEKPAVEKKHFILGRAAHHLLLGEEAFHTHFVVRPDEAPDDTGRAWNGNNNACKAWLLEQAKKRRTVLTSANIKQIRGMAHALAQNSYVRTGILDGIVEHSLIWQDKKTGLWLKSRPDVIPTDSGDFADLKTTSFYSYEIDRQGRDKRYDIQAALAKWGCKEVLGLDLVSFADVFVTVKRPHMVDVLTIEQNDIGEAERDLRLSIDTLAWCLKNNNWFGPSGTQQTARPMLFNDMLDERFKKTNVAKRERLLKEMAMAEAVSSQAIV